MPFPSPILYSIATLPNGKVDSDKLASQVNSLGLATALVRLDTAGDELACWFAADVSDADKATLDTTVLAHDGIPVPRYVLVASSSIMALERPVTGLTSWEEMGGVVTTPDFLVPDLTRALGRLVFQHKGAGGEVRLVEVRGSDGVETVLGSTVLPDTAAAFKASRVTTTAALSAGTNEYRVDARLNGAASLALRYMSMSLLQRTN